MTSHIQFRAASAAALLVAAATFVGGSVRCLAQAQNPPAFEEMPLHTLSSGSAVANWNTLLSFMRDDIKAITTMLEGGPMDQAKFDQFFNDVVFPMFTQRRNFTETTVSPAQMRKRFKSTFVAAAKSAPARERLLDLTLASMQKIATGNYHPIARGNAMLMIAELNDGEPGPPVKKALPILVKAAQDKSAPEVVRVPAIRGIARHAATTGGIDANQRGPVVAAMLEIVKVPTPSPEQSLVGHEWILRRAIDVLAALGEPGNNGECFHELVKLIENDAAPRAARATAAAALSKINYTPPKEFDMAELATALGKLSVTAYKAELAATESKRYPVVTERLKQQLAEIRAGLVGADGNGGIAAALSAEPQKKFAADLVAQIDALTAACDTPMANRPDPMAIQQQNAEYVQGVPFDTQEPIVAAITKAGGALEAVVQAGPGGAPAGSELPDDLPNPGPPARAAAPAARGGVPSLPPG